MGPRDRRPAREWRRSAVPVPLDAAGRARGPPSVARRGRPGGAGLAVLWPSLDETIWVGLSAGSMVMTPRIGEDFVGWKPPTGSDGTLGLGDFSIFPHLNNPALPENTMADAERWAAGMAIPCYAIDDQTAIKVLDDTV